VLGVASWLVGRRDPVALAQIWMIVSTTVVVFSFVIWWHSKIRAAGLTALAVAPVAITLALLSLRRR
jgi:hypothetical protein